MSRFGSIAGSTLTFAGSAGSTMRVPGLDILTTLTLTTIGGMTITGPSRAGTG